MKITKEYIESFRTSNGGYTKEVLAMFGVEWPPQKGWKDGLIGKEMILKVGDRVRVLGTTSATGVGRVTAITNGLIEVQFVDGFEASYQPSALDALKDGAA